MKKNNQKTENIQIKENNRVISSSDLLSAIPTNWLDPLLTGNDAVISKVPLDGQDLEMLLRAIKQRLKKIISG